MGFRRIMLKEPFAMEANGEGTSPVNSGKGTSRDGNGPFRDGRKWKKMVLRRTTVKELFAIGSREWRQPRPPTTHDKGHSWMTEKHVCSRSCLLSVPVYTATNFSFSIFLLRLFVWEFYPSREKGSFVLDF